MVNFIRTAAMSFVKRRFPVYIPVFTPPEKFPVYIPVFTPPEKQAETKPSQRASEKDLSCQSHREVHRGCLEPYAYKSCG